MIQTVEYKAAHALEILYGSCRNDDAWYKSEAQLTQWATAREEGGPGWSMLSDGLVMACGGFQWYWTGSAEAWFLISPVAQGKIKIILRAAKGVIAGFSAGRNVRRLQAYVDSRDPAAERLARHLGFFKGPTLRAFGPDGQDMVIYEIVREGANE